MNTMASSSQAPDIEDRKELTRDDALKIFPHILKLEENKRPVLEYYLSRAPDYYDSKKAKAGSDDRVFVQKENRKL